MFEVPLGYQEATCAIIGNCIGGYNVSLAKRFFKLTALVALASILTLQMVILLIRDDIARFYTSDPAIQELASSVLVLSSFIFLVDGM